MKSKSEVFEDFLKSVLTVISKNSSQSYSIVIMNKLKEELAGEFPFLKWVELKGSTVQMDHRMDKVDTSEMGRLLNKIIDVLGPNMLRFFIKEQLDSEDIKYLNAMGVKF